MKSSRSSTAARSCPGRADATASASTTRGFVDGWVGFYLHEGSTLAAGILVHELRDHLSVAYGAFDPAHRGLDLEHYLIMQVIERCARHGVPSLSLGMDTNRYGHHLALGLPAYKLRIGFTPLPWEPAGRELVKFQRTELFEKGLFFYSYDGKGIVGNLFTREADDDQVLGAHAGWLRVPPKKS